MIDNYFLENEIKRIIYNYYKNIGYIEKINFSGDLLLFYFYYYDSKNSKYTRVKIYTNIKNYRLIIKKDNEIVKIQEYGNIEEYYSTIKNISVSYFLDYLNNEFKIEIKEEVEIKDIKIEEKDKNYEREKQYENEVF
jgi:hypothetical protein